jgi:hypothetical protein
MTDKGLGSVRIHRNHVIAAPAKLFEQRGAEVSALARHSNHSDPFLGQEVLNGFERGTVG